MTSIAARYGIDRRQAEFAKAIVRGQKPEEAWKTAGFEPGHSIRAYDLMHLPAVSVAIRSHLQKIIETDDAPQARRVLRTLMDDVESGARVRVDAAKILLGMAGFSAKPDKGEDEAKQLTEMNPEELRAFIDKHQAEIQKVEGELASRATLVNPPVDAPNTSPNSALPLDLLD